MTDWFYFTQAHCWIPCRHRCIMGRLASNIKQKLTLRHYMFFCLCHPQSESILSAFLRSFQMIPISLRYTKPREEKKHISEQKGEPLTNERSRVSNRMPQMYNLYKVLRRKLSWAFTCCMCTACIQAVQTFPDHWIAIWSSSLPAHCAPMWWHFGFFFSFLFRISTTLHSIVFASL